MKLSRKKIKDWISSLPSRKRIKDWISSLPFPAYKLILYCFSLLLIGVACSAIYWPSGLLAVGGLIWLDLFVSDLIVQVKMDLSGRDDDVRNR